MSDRDGQDWLSRDYPTAYRTACLLLCDPVAARDAVHEAFLWLWRFRDAVPAGDARRPWLYRAVVNACSSRVHAEQAAGDREPGPQGHERLDAEPSRLAGPAGVSADVIAALVGLPVALRVPLVLQFWAGLSDTEIAVAIDRRPSAVRSRLHDARQRLALDPRLSGWAVPTAEVFP